MRPLLRPGTHVLRRGDGRLQIGLDPADAVVLPDSPAVRSCLDSIAGGETCTDDPERHHLLNVLEQHDVLVDESAVMPLVGSEPAGSNLPRATGAALARAAGATAADAATARARTRIHLAGFGHPSGAELLTDLTTLLGRAGLRIRRPRNDHVPGAVPVIGLLAGVGEPDREPLDRWIRDGVPHLVVRVSEGRAVIGPFVEPGATACVRCIDAHHTDADPGWPLLVRQYAEAASRDRRDGTPEPVDPAQVAAALALAVHDVATYAGGGCPSSWSATLTLDADLAELHSRPWRRHPDCGCWWE